MSRSKRGQLFHTLEPPFRLVGDYPLTGFLLPTSAHPQVVSIARRGIAIFQGKTGAVVL
jgi:hypothetical protein